MGSIDSLLNIKLVKLFNLLKFKAIKLVKIPKFSIPDFKQH